MYSPSTMNNRIDLQAMRAVIFTAGTLEETVDGVWKDIFTFCRHKPNDDMLLLGVEIPDPPPQNARMERNRRKKMQKKR